MYALLVPMLAILVSTSTAPSASPAPIPEGLGTVAADSASTSLPLTLRPGVRVRVFSRALGKAPMAGLATALRGDTLSFMPDAYSNTTLRVLLDDSTRVDLSAAHRHRTGQGLLTGGAVGLGIGLLIVGIAQMTNDVGEAGESIGDIWVGERPPEHKEVSRAPIFIGLVAGCAVGALMGSGKTDDTWVPGQVPRAVSFGISSDGPRGIRLALILR